MQSQDPNQKSIVALNLIQEQELDSPFKSRINQNQEILWQSCNQENDDVGVQIFNTPKQHLQKGSPKMDSVIKSYKNINSTNIIQSPDKEFYNNSTIYQNYNFLQKLFLYHILCFMKKMWRVIQSPNVKISLTDLPKQDFKNSIQYNLKRVYEQIKNNDDYEFDNKFLFKLFFWYNYKYETIIIIILAMCETYSRFFMAI